MTNQEIEYLKTILVPQIESVLRGRRFSEQATVFNTAIGHNHDGRNSRFLPLDTLLQPGEGIDVTVAQGIATIAAEDASETNKGIVELATDTETLTGTDTARSLTPANLEYARAQSGWIPAGETWSYASADDPTYTFTISGDKTGKYSAGMRIRVSQSTGGTKYFLVTKVAYSSPNTTVTVYGGTDYDLNNETISSPYYSTQKAPVGFPLDRTKWDQEVTNTTEYYTNSPSAGTWYNGSSGACAIVVPIGSWYLSMKTHMYANHASSGVISIAHTLSTTTNSETDARFTVMTGDYNSRPYIQYVPGFTGEHPVTLAAKATYTALYKTDHGSLNAIYFHNSTNRKLVIRAVCALL